MTLRVAHMTTIDSSLDLLLAHEFAAIAMNGDVPIAISAPGKYGGKLNERGIQVVQIENLSRKWSITNDAKAGIQLWKILPALKLDVLHTHTPKAGVLGRIIGRMRGVPVIVNTCHGLPFSESDRPLKKIVILGVEAIASQFSDAELFQNTEDLRRLGWACGRKATFVGNGIEIERFQKNPDLRARIRSELGFDDETIVVGGVGRRVAEKGIREFSQSARDLSDKARFVWIGPSDTDKADAVEDELPSVMSLGMRTDMPAIYSALDIFVLPSYREGFPRSAMEACAAELPVVLTDIRGSREIGETGQEVLFAEPRNSDSLTAALRLLIEDPKLRKTLARSGYLRAVHAFDGRQVAAKSYDAYKSSKRFKRLSEGRR